MQPPLHSCVDLITENRFSRAGARSLRRAAAVGAWIIFGTIVSQAAQAEVYKWTDAKGQIHFSDKPPPNNDKSAQKSVAQIKLGSAGPSFNVRRLTPVADSGGASRMPLRLAAVSNGLLQGATDFVAGQYFTGATCADTAPLLLSSSEIDFASPMFQSLIAGAFADGGWKVQGADGNAAGMDLKGDVAALRVDRCAPGDEAGTAPSGARAYVRLRWTLTSASGETIFRGSSEGAHDGWTNGTEYSVAIQNALTMAANNLLADNDFVAKVREQRVSGSALSAAGAATEADIQWGDASGTFAQRLAAVQSATLIVQTHDGVGSGVIIDLNGWALTSARLVGNQPNVMVTTGKLTLPAAVVKRDELSDVALLRFVRNDFTSVLIAPNAVLPGDSVQLVTAPKTAGSANTVTRTELVSELQEQGKQRFQLATTERYSNAGAPVFNRHGELAGLVSMAPVHAGVGVEGLRMVPILQALHAIGIDMR